MKIVHDLRVIKAMAKKGLVELSQDTGEKVRHWTGRTVKAVYISSGPYEFEYKSKRYGVRFFDGCFNPFVVDLEDPSPKASFV